MSWTTQRVKFFYDVVDRRAGNDQPPLLAVSIHHGVVPRSMLTDDLPRAEDLSNYKLCEPGDIVLNRMRAFQGAIGISPLRGIVSPDYMVLRPAPTVEPRFLHHLFRSNWFVGEMIARLRGIGGTESGAVRTPRINAEDLGDISAVIPSVDEQRRIAGFLDAETARLDQLSEVRSKQAASLSELEFSLIGSRLAGSDCPGERFQTGWPWMPSLPAGWRIGPVYTYYSVQLGKMLNPDSAGGAHQQSYLRNANVHWFSIDTSDIATMSFAPEERERFRVREGDLLVCEGGAGVAEAAIWDGRIEHCYYQKSLHRVRRTSRLPAEWLMYWLRFSKASGVFDADGNIATIPHLTGEQFREYRIPIPPDADRRVKELGEAITNIRATHEALANAASLLAERKQALITAAVTGQIDVTTARGADAS